MNSLKMHLHLDFYGKDISIETVRWKHYNYGMKFDFDDLDRLDLLL